MCPIPYGMNDSTHRASRTGMFQRLNCVQRRHRLYGAQSLSCVGLARFPLRNQRSHVDQSHGRGCRSLRTRAQDTNPAFTSTRTEVRVNLASVVLGDSTTSTVMNTRFLRKLAKGGCAMATHCRRRLQARPYSQLASGEAHGPRNQTHAPPRQLQRAGNSKGRCRAAATPHSCWSSSRVAPATRDQHATALAVRRQRAASLGRVEPTSASGVRRVTLADTRISIYQRPPRCSCTPVTWTCIG
ncbi:hypothetical protein C8Q72DRAFT_484905 [Fomitopsis betulina]|nr:hypothetical protein C8Q72DRAFT_484905 [Fomitopsis betulina]